ncbi:hypothetical protein [Achromobacter sp.]|uniref:hypothetical protein n=1 Tax=Achromobacter sp. TaxID=134375 RepID=UPI003CFFC34D
MATKRGAKPIPAAEPAAPALDGELLDARSQELAAMNEHQQAVIEQYGDGLPWSAEHYETQIRSELRRGCEAFLRAGRYLVVARECAAHGEWQGMLDRLGIEASHARRMMEAARRVTALPNRARAHDLIAAAGTQSKLIELLSLPEDQFQELASEGATGDLEVDDIAAMSRDELRAAVREARADIEAKDDRAAKRERDIENLQKKLRQAKLERQRAEPDDIAGELRTLASAAALQVRADIGATGDDVESLQERIAALCEHAAGAGGDGDEHHPFMGALIGELFSELRRVRDAFGLPIVNDHGAPDWQQGL